MIESGLQRIIVGRAAGGLIDACARCAAEKNVQRLAGGAGAWDQAGVPLEQTGHPNPTRSHVARLH